MSGKFKELTIGELKEKLKDIPDNLIVRLSSDTGVDQSEDEGYEIKILDAWRHHCILSDGKTFEDGSNEVDEFHIYANHVGCSEEE